MSDSTPLSPSTGYNPGKQQHHGEVAVAKVAFKFIQEGPGEAQRERAKKAVRSHVTRAYHKQRRERKTREYQESQALKASSKEAETEGGSATIVRIAEDVDNPETRLVLPAVQRALSYNNNLIPYTFFDPTGPVLMLPRSSRPFYQSNTNQPYSPEIFPRHSLWMPNAEIPDAFKVNRPIHDLEVVDWISNTPGCFQYRVDTIKWVQDRLMTQELAMEDDTIGAIMTLTMWESYRSKLNPSDLVSHMNILEQLVNLRGGLDAMSSEQAVKLALIDHILAVMTLRAPRFPLQGRPVLFPTASPRPRLHDSPLYGDVPFSSFIVGTGADAEISVLFEDLRSLTQLALAGLLVPRPASVTITAPPTPNNPLHATLLAAARIYTAALYSNNKHSIFSSPFFYPALQTVSKNLNETSRDEFWIMNPGIRLWAILVGAACAVYWKERGYYMMYLARVGIFDGSREGDAAYRRWCEIFSSKAEGEVTAAI